MAPETRTPVSGTTESTAVDSALLSSFSAGGVNLLVGDPGSFILGELALPQAEALDDVEVEVLPQSLLRDLFLRAAQIQRGLLQGAPNLLVEFDRHLGAHEAKHTANQHARQSKSQL